MNSTSSIPISLLDRHADLGGNLLDGHIGMAEEACRPLHSSLTQISVGSLSQVTLEQPCEMIVGQLEFSGKRCDGEGFAKVGLDNADRFGYHRVNRLRATNRQLGPFCMLPQEIP